MRRKWITIAVLLAALLSLWQIGLVSGTELPYRCIDLEKTGPETAAPGETITYHFWVYNCGDVPFLSGAQVRDLLLKPWGGKIWEGDLYPGDIAEFERTYTVPANYCGELVNDAWAVGLSYDEEGNYYPTVKDKASWPTSILCAPGTGTPGYWMNHPEAWPVAAITIGVVDYPKLEAIMYMKAEVEGDKTFTMFPALVAAKLNVMIGNDDSCIADVIAAADTWMASHPVGSDVPGMSEAWEMGEPLYEALDDYNNGDASCVSSRDDFE